jgi:hypothetical protein
MSFNKKGVLFTTDMIIATSVIIFVIGAMYVLYHETVIDAVELKQEKGIDSAINIALNKLAINDNSCLLVDKDDNPIKKIAFCIDTSKPKLNLNNLIDDYSIYVENLSIGALNIPEDTDYIAKEVDVWLKNGNVEKSEYFNCTEGNCDLNNKVKVYAWK